MSERELDGIGREAEALLSYRGDPSDPHVEPLDDLARRRVLDRALAGFEDRTATGGRRDRSSSRRRIGLAAAAALFLLATGAAVALLARSPGTGTTAGTAATAGTVADRGMAPGDAVVTREGSSTLDLPTGIRTAVAPGSRVRIARFDAEEIAVRLDHGEIVAALDAGRAGPPFVVESPAGRIRVTGTVFRVEVASAVTVDVLRGAVRVEDGLHDEPIRAGDRAILGTAGTGRVPEHDESPALAAARAGGLLEGIDAPARDPAPPSPGGALPPPAASAPAAIPAAVPAATPRREEEAGADALLLRAGELRAARDWDGAAAAYREVVERFPDASQARTSLLSLGEIELAHLDRPADALSRFERYLVSWPGGSLAPEAEFGRARALGRLGRRAEEVQALRELIARHPGSLLAERARARLDALESATGP
jgi:ferric-dicitrate binding protein FerR (iron transport regulator)